LRKPILLWKNTHKEESKDHELDNEKVNEILSQLELKNILQLEDNQFQNEYEKISRNINKDEKTLVTIINHLIRSGNYSFADYFCNKIITEHIKENGNIVPFSKLWILYKLKAEILNQLGQIDEQYDNINKMILITQLHKGYYSEEMFVCFFDIFNFYFHIGENKTAFLFLNKIDDIYNKIQKKEKISFLIIQTSLINSLIKNTKELYTNEEKYKKYIIILDRYKDIKIKAEEIIKSYQTTVFDPELELLLANLLLIDIFINKDSEENEKKSSLLIQKLEQQLTNKKQSIEANKLISEILAKLYENKLERAIIQNNLQNFQTYHKKIKNVYGDNNAQIKPIIYYNRLLELCVFITKINQSHQEHIDNTIKTELKKIEKFYLNFYKIKEDDIIDNKVVNFNLAKYFHTSALLQMNYDAEDSINFATIASEIYKKIVGPESEKYQETEKIRKTVIEYLELKGNKKL
jgi:hypothetical protein